MTIENAERDNNYVTSVLFKGSDGDAHPVKGDEATGRMYVDLAGGSGTVTSVSVVTANGVSGSVATATTTPAITLTLGAITPTSVNGLTITTTTGTLTIAAAKTLTVSNTLTLTGTDGSSVAFGAGGTVAYVANKLSVFAATTSAELRGVISDETGTGVLVFADTPTLITPVLGVATATSINGLTITTSTGTLTIANSKVLTVSNTLTFTGTDSSSVAFGAGGTVAYLGTAQTFTALNTYSFAGLPVRVVNTSDAGASNQALKLESDRATPAANDEVYESYILSNSTGVQTEFGRITVRGTTVTNTSEVGRMAFSVITAGSLTEELYLTGTALSPAADGGNSLGTTTLGWQNLFGNTGFVFNLENGDWVATHTAGILTVGTGDLRVTTAGTNTASVVTVGGTQTLTAKTLTSPTINTASLGGTQLLAEGASIGLDPSGSADGAYSGITMTATAGYTQAFGDLNYLAVADSRWELTDADAATTADRLLAMVVVAGTDGNACTLLMMGTIRADAKFPALTVGAAVYVGETAGEIQVAIPTGADNVIRRVGYALTADSIYFNPSMDAQTAVA